MTWAPVHASVTEPSPARAAKPNCDPVLPHGAVSLTVENGRITRIYAIRNPHKLAGLDGIAALTRS